MHNLIRFIGWCMVNYNYAPCCYVCECTPIAQISKKPGGPAASDIGSMQSKTGK